MNKWSIDSYVFRIADERKAVEEALWDAAFSDDSLLRELCRQCGWQGGTIHQVVDYVMQQKAKWNAGGRLSYRV